MLLWCVRTLYFGSYQPINRFSHLNTEYDLFYITVKTITPFNISNA